MPDPAYDAVLVLSFGGPEKTDDVIPFLENVLRGRNVPRERMLAVAEHYYHFGGRSPINDQNRALVAALRRELADHGLQLPVYWGNRNWHPLLADTLRQMRDDGVRNALAFVTSIFSSYSGCRQYLEDIERASAQVEGAPRIHKLRKFYNHPLFIEAQSEEVREALGRAALGGGRAALDCGTGDVGAVLGGGTGDLGAVLGGGTDDGGAALGGETRGGRELQIVFTAHSIPLSMAETCDYQKQLAESCRLVTENLGIGEWRLVYQSRSGPPGQPWLEPDIADVVRQMERGTEVVVVPIGFVSDHIEVIYDLDTEVQAIARERGVKMLRAPTVEVHPKFLQMIRELIEERLGLCRPRAIGQCPPSHDVCPAACCPAPVRRPSSALSDSSPRAIAQR
jgi:ferrochelatase